MRDRKSAEGRADGAVVSVALALGSVLVRFGARALATRVPLPRGAGAPVDARQVGGCAAALRRAARRRSRAAAGDERVDARAAGLVHTPFAHGVSQLGPARRGRTVVVTRRARFVGMNQTISPSRLISRFVAYRVALDTVRLVAVASARWRGWAHLADQARRASTSVTGNLSEGNGHPPGSPERRRYQRIALASALELEGHLDNAASADLGDPGELAAARGSAGRSAALCTALCRR